MRRLLILVAISTLLASIASFSTFPAIRAHAAQRETPIALTSPNVSAPFSVYSPLGNVTSIASPSDYHGAGVHFFDTHNNPLQLTGIQYFVVAQHSGPGFPFSVHALPGVRVGDIELAINPHAGTELLAVGIPTPASAARVDALDGTPANTTSTGTPISVNPNTSTGYAPLHLIWSDRVGIYVVEVHDNLTWLYNGVTVSISNINDSDRWEWQSGWNRSQYQTSSGYDYSSGLPVDAYDTTTSSYWNGGFCGGATTYIFVYYNTAVGYKDGSRAMSINTTTAGCPGALYSWGQWG